MATIIVSKNTTGTYANTGYNGFVDTKLRGLNPTTNYSTDTTFATTSWDKSAGDVETTVLKADISSVGAGTVSSAEIGFYLDNGNNVDSSGVSLFALLVDFVETQATFNIRKTSNNWNTGGARGSGTDRQSTAFTTVSRPATSGAWIQFSGTAVDDMVQDWLDGTLTNNGFVAELQNHDIDPFFTYQSYISSEGTDGNRPYLKFDHTASGGGTQTLTPNLFSNTNTFYTATVGRSAVSLTAPLLTNTQTFYATTVNAAYGLTPDLFTNNNTFYNATVATSYTASAGLFTNNSAFYSANVTYSNTLTPELLSNTSTFYNTLITSGLALAPDLFSNAQTFYSASFSVGAVNLTPNLLSNASQFYSPVAQQEGGTQLLAPNLVNNNNAFFNSTFSTTYTVSAELVTNASVIYAPVATASNQIVASLLVNTETFYDSTIIFDQALLAGLLINTNAFYNANLRLALITPIFAPRNSNINVSKSIRAANLSRGKR